MQRAMALLALVCLAALAFPARAQVAVPPRGTVLTGLEVLIDQDFAILRGKRVGLITNPTGITRDFRTTVDVLAKAPGLNLVALFGPEHGVRGDAPAGERVANARDARTGLPEYSLYGATRKPTAAMLRGIDALVFDIQDIGSRSYTYINTMGYAMEAAAENKIPFYVLDRPNPIGGNRVEGNILDMRFKSGVGAYPIPYCHGMTVGELARMINARGWLSRGVKCDLFVVPMAGYARSTRWKETGLPWVPTSPHIPRADTAYFYAATGIVGELPTLSIGVGYTLPFELAGAPGISGDRLSAELERRRLPGVRFRPASWRPYYLHHTGKTCGGVQIHITDPDRAQLTRINFEVMDAVRRLYPKIRFLGEADRAAMFDKVCGTDRVRRMFVDGASAARVWATWNADAARFRVQRKPFLLYR